MAASFERLASISAAVVGLLAIGCGPQFDPPHELRSLRVLGVQKDKPYAQPGDTVELRMLWHDGADKGQRTIQRAWFAGCTNPPGDLYQACIPQLVESARAALEGGTLPSGVGFDTDVFSFQVPADVIDGRPPPADPEQPSYGLSYVFFAVCAGQFALDLEGGQSFPLRCLDEKDEPLGPDDFVVGYTAIYSFSGIFNQNPIVTGFEFRGQPIEPDCIGAECLTAPDADIDCDDPDQASRCVPSCKDDGDPTCDEHPLRVVVDPASAEIDEVSVELYGRTLTEQMWVNYYVDRGGLRSGVRLLNDASKGWNDDNGTDFYAPDSAGPVKIWAVAHDNRGGTEFARITIGVR